MHSEKCPVCNGNGLVPHGFYNQTSGDWSAASTEPEKCHGCEGKGWITVGEAVDVRPMPYPTSPYVPYPPWYRHDWYEPWKITWTCRQDSTGDPPPGMEVFPTNRNPPGTEIAVNWSP